MRFLFYPIYFLSVNFFQISEKLIKFRHIFDLKDASQGQVWLQTTPQPSEQIRPETSFLSHTELQDAAVRMYGADR